MSSRRLEKNLKRQVDRAAALQQPDRSMQIDVVARGEDESALGVVARSLELLVPPPLDSVDLCAVQHFEFRRRHLSPPFRIRMVRDTFPRLFVHYDVSVVPFLGGLG